MKKNKPMKTTGKMNSIYTSIFVSLNSDHASSWNNVKFQSTVRQTHLNLSRCLSNPQFTTQMKSPEKSGPYTHESKMVAELVNTWKSRMTPLHHILSEYLHDLNLGFFATRTSDSFLTTSLSLQIAKLQITSSIPLFLRTKQILNVRLTWSSIS